MRAGVDAAPSGTSKDMTRQTPSKPQLAKTITIYGRKPVLEALNDSSLPCQTLHWASSNRVDGSARALLAAAEARNVERREHSRETLARISRNGRQDQGVALDIRCPAFATSQELMALAQNPRARVLALDGITNPQNVGMILRSATAGNIDAVLYPRRGVAALGPLVIKASAGTAFRAPIALCDLLTPSLKTLKEAGFAIATLEGEAQCSLFEWRQSRATIFVLGGETDGVSAAARALSDVGLRIPMSRGVESLNVAVTGALIAYSSSL
jgi:23S rRNA (guanosine2251-2'-O)-methyltransferase